MKTYKQNEKCIIKIKGKLTKIQDIKLAISNPSHKPRYVEVLYDENNVLFIKNPYNCFYLPFKVCDYFHNSSLDTLLKNGFKLS